MPAVPLAPGVPPLAGDSPLPAPAVLSIDSPTVTALNTSPARWGLFLNGVPAVIAESVVTVDFKQDWLVSDYPVEQGQFQSYDKVQLPFDFRIRFAQGGFQADRSNMLAGIEAAANSLNIYDALTPERIYTSVNVIHFDYRRTAVNGVGLLVVDVWLRQIRQNVSVAFTNTQQPDGSDPQSAGAVQPEPVTGLLPGPT